MGSIYHVQPVSCSNAFELPKASYNVHVDQYPFHLHRGESEREYYIERCKDSALHTGDLQRLSELLINQSPCRNSSR